jgi:hypothetical protein
VRIKHKYSTKTEEKVELVKKAKGVVIANPSWIVIDLYSFMYLL